MNMKKTLLALAAAGTLMGMGTAANAQIQIITEVAPPVARYEVAPAPRAGYVWEAGHYELRNDRYVWVEGRWLTARSGHIYDQPRWVQRNGQWQYVAGNWRRGPMGDRDRDGIPNAYDRDRDGDGVPNAYDNNRGRRDRFGPNGDLDRDGIANRSDRDRDGDGVRNARDRYPNDRRAS
ncbi:YXWGXW repeat-containing protein [Ramlibacter sp.]|uniref:YXWGXW repeat-containing protein n=1 Tax=Ramlibacter sp. TaxID=1917967 RepID=UPI003D12E191